MSRQAIAWIVLAAACVGGSAPADSSEKLADPTRKFDLTPRSAAGEQIRVTADLKVGGHLKIRDEQQVDAVPMSVVARLRYDQRMLGERTRDDLPPRAIRHYEEATATIKIKQGGVDLSLAPESGQIVAERSSGRVTLYRVEGLLTREELDLIDMLGDPLALDRLLPAERVAVAATFPQDEMAIQALLGLDSIAAADVESVLVGVERGYAKIRMTGSAHGTVDGSATEMEIQASYLFHLATRRIARLNLAVREKRAIGQIGPGVEAVSHLQLTNEAIATSPHLAGVEPPQVRDSSHLRLLYEDRDLGVRLAHDRHWFVTSAERNRVVLRRLDSSEMIAQCNLVVLPDKSAGRQTLPAQFQKDIRFSLGDRLERLAASSQWTTAAGVECFRVVAHGKVADVPVEWRYYRAAPPSGPPVSLAVSVEGTFASRLGDADRRLVDGLEIVPPDRDADPPAAATTGQAKADAAPQRR